MTDSIVCSNLKSSIGCDTACPMSKYFFVEQCPANHTYYKDRRDEGIDDGNRCPCSTDSWKRKGVWGWTDEECRERLLAHLVESGFHKMNANDAMSLTDSEILQTETYDLPRKRPRPPSLPPPQPVPVDDDNTSLATHSDPIIGSDITLRRMDFQSILDSVSRSVLAVRQAQRLAAAATRAFSDEASNLENIKSALESIQAESELVMP